MQGLNQAQRLRQLQQAAAAADVTVVRSAQQLWDAVAEGTPHIEIREHLDITDLRDPTAAKHSSLPVQNLGRIQSIRVRPPSLRRTPPHVQRLHAYA